MKRISANQYQTFERYYKLTKILFESERYKGMKLEVRVAYAVLKNHLLPKTGKFFLKTGYQIKILDLVSMMTSNGFNPFRYVENENDLNRLLTVYFNNTKGNVSRSNPSFAEISKLIKLLHKSDGAEKSVLELMFEHYAKTYGTENFTMRNWADFQNYKDKTLD